MNRRDPHKIVSVTIPEYVFRPSGEPQPNEVLEEMKGLRADFQELLKIFRDKF